MCPMPPPSAHFQEQPSCSQPGGAPRDAALPQVRRGSARQQARQLSCPVPFVPSLAHGRLPCGQASTVLCKLASETILLSSRAASRKPDSWIIAQNLPAPCLGPFAGLPGHQGTSGPRPRLPKGVTSCLGESGTRILLPTLLSTAPLPLLFLPGPGLVP